MPTLDRDKMTAAAEKAVLVRVNLPGGYTDLRDPFGELRSLAATAGAQVVGELMQNLPHPRGATYLGKGKVEELAELVPLTGASLVIFDNDLSPAQVKELEEALQVKVIDRSELILDIFANRAATAAAKLQVEIAQLEYTYPRLRRMWTHLGQVTGGAPVGIGTRGPGEKQLETDRRLVQGRLKQLKRELEEIQRRKSREVADRTLNHYTIGLVGYTNAGKSTLFNRLTTGGAFEAPMLFSTLSTRIERWDLGGGNAALLSDTVGFIRDLPHHLIASFRSTLEETIVAHLLMIVVDASDPGADMHLATVHETLGAIGATTQPRLLVLNKVDLLPATELLVMLHRHPEAVAVSAATGTGLEDLRAAALEHMLGEVREVTIEAAIDDGRTVSFLESRTQVLDRQYPDGRVELRVRMGRRQAGLLLAQGARVRFNGIEGNAGVRAAWNEAAAPAVSRGVPPHVRFQPAR
jgi:GTP-binding protein HflX